MNHAVSFGQSYDNDVTVTYIAPLYYTEVFESMADLHFLKAFQLLCLSRDYLATSWGPDKH